MPPASNRFHLLPFLALLLFAVKPLSSLFLLTHMASLLDSSMHSDALEVLQRIGLPDGTNALVLRRGSATKPPQPNRGEVVIFSSFMVAGLVPPFSEFFLFILDFYQIHLAHLVPNSIVVLSTFAHF